MILYAIPTPLGGTPIEALPASTIEKIKTLKDFAVENAKSARAFLGAIGLPVRELNIRTLDEENLLQPLREGRAMGLLSEAGCPAIADPGAALIEAAHREGFRVVPLVGPSSITLALMASGLEGQRFAFCGYLPREPAARAQDPRARSPLQAGEGNADFHRDPLPERRAARRASGNMLAPNTRVRGGGSDACG